MVRVIFGSFTTGKLLVPPGVLVNPAGKATKCDPLSALIHDSTFIYEFYF